MRNYCYRGGKTDTSQTIEMATLELLPVGELIARGIIERRKTHKQISEELKCLYPGVRGLSARSVRRFCENHNAHSSSMLSNADLDRVVSSSIAKVGPVIG